MHIYYCHYEYQVDDAKTGESYRERGYVEIKTHSILTDDLIEFAIQDEWKRKKITNRTIIEIFEPEKII